MTIWETACWIKIEFWRCNMFPLYLSNICYNVYREFGLGQFVKEENIRVTNDIAELTKLSASSFNFISDLFATLEEAVPGFEKYRINYYNKCVPIFCHFETFRFWYSKCELFNYLKNVTVEKYCDTQVSVVESVSIMVIPSFFKYLQNIIFIYDVFRHSRHFSWHETWNSEETKNILNKFRLIFAENNYITSEEDMFTRSVGKCAKSSIIFCLPNHYWENKSNKNSTKNIKTVTCCK